MDLKTLDLRIFKKPELVINHMHQTLKYLEYAVLINRPKRKGAKLKNSPKLHNLSRDCGVARKCTLYPNNKFI